MAEYLLPDVGEGLTEAEIVAWKVKVGDVIAINAVSYTHLTLPTNREV